MRPLAARCNLALALLHRHTSAHDRATHELKAAAASFRELGMRVWFDRAEAEASRPA